MHNVITVGRRKTATARVHLKSGSGKISINKRTLDLYFPIETQRKAILQPLEITESAGRFDLAISVSGGGPTGQAGAVQLGISRALVEMNEELRAQLRQHGLLTRDPRKVERKKYGQKKARKRFQFSKR